MTSKAGKLRANQVPLPVGEAMPAGLMIGIESMLPDTKYNLWSSLAVSFRLNVPLCT